MKKLFSLLLVFCLVATIIPSVPMTASAEEYWEEYGGWKIFYTVTDGEATITDAFHPGWMSPFSIPDTLGGYPVTTIGEFAVSHCYYMTSLIISNNVTSIEDCAFFGCESLTSVTIGDSVTSIGDGAFSGCWSLDSIYVSENNPSYSSVDGVLFNKNKTKLIKYPEGKCTPAGKRNITYAIPNSVNSIGRYAFDWCSLFSVNIPESVTNIEDYAFDYCPTLTDIYYEGTEDEWNAISIGSENAPLKRATIHYETPVEEIIDFGFCGEKVAWTLDNKGTLCISGTGPMTNYGGWEGPFAGNNKITSIVIQNGVTSIGNSAFFDCKALTITIPNSVKTIGEFAFESSSTLTSIVIPDSVTTIGTGAFYNCRALTSITIPDSVTTIGGGAFFGCYSLSSIDISENNPSYSFEDGVLFNKDKTKLIRYLCGKTDTTYTIPDSVTTIGSDGFWDCVSLNSITIPDSVSSIENGAFSGCFNLKSVNMGDGVRTIGDWAFYSCEALTDVYYTGTEEEWNAISIGNYNEPLIETNVHYNWSFEPDESLYTYKVSNGKATITGFDSSCSRAIIPSTLGGYPVTAIGDRAFEECYDLISVTIPDSVITIGDSAFGACWNLSSINIPDSVTTIGGGAFSGCYSLSSIYVSENNPSYSSEAGVLFNKDKTTVISYPAGKEDASYIIPDSVTVIGDSAFVECYNLTSISLGNRVTTIGERAFVACFATTSINIPDSVTTIGQYAFSGCNMSSVTIPDNVTVIEEGTFSYCSSLETVTIPNSVTSIEMEAFEQCDALTDVYYTGSEEDWKAISIGEYNEDLTSATIHCNWTLGPDESLYTYTVLNGEATITRFYSPSSRVLIPSTLGGYPVTAIGDRAFEECYNLISVTIPDGVITIGDSAFEACSNLTSINIPDSVITIGDSAFGACWSLSSINIPDSVTTIGRRAFSDCYSLPSIYVSENNPSYSSEAGVLFNKDKTTVIRYPAGKEDASYIIPDSVTVIGDSAFVECLYLTSISLGNRVTTIGEWAFMACWSLSSINIPDSVTTIGQRAFAYCSSLETVIIPDSVTTIGQHAFNGCNMSSITIPDNVTVIEEGTFAYCRSLETVTIPNSVTSIEMEAFEQCDALTDVYYTGSEEDWKAINIESENEPLTDATIHYNYRPVKVKGGISNGTLTVTPQNIPIGSRVSYAAYKGNQMVDFGTFLYDGLGRAFPITVSYDYIKIFAWEDLIPLVNPTQIE